MADEYYFKELFYPKELKAQGCWLAAEEERIVLYQLPQLGYCLIFIDVDCL